MHGKEHPLLIRIASYEDTKSGTVKGDARRDDIVAGNREGEGTGECIEDSHALVHLASAAERCWNKLQ